MPRFPVEHPIPRGLCLYDFSGPGVSHLIYINYSPILNMYLWKNTKQGELILVLIARQESSRRSGLFVKFPLTDSRGVAVIQDRRRTPDRRKVKASILDLVVKLSKKVIG